MSIDALLGELDAAPKWPLPRERRYLEAVTLRRALRCRDADVVKRAARWAERFTANRRDYVVDPLPRTIGRAFGAFLYGTAPTITPGDERDEELVRALELESRLDAVLPRAVRLAVSEGEAWWHAYTSPEHDAPVVEYVSRLRTVPLWRFGVPAAVGFVTTVDSHDDERLRLVELHEAGRVVNVLYRGKRDELGRRVPLEASASTYGMAEEWRHGLPMLAGRVVNDLDDDPRLGESDFDPILDHLLALNEASTIGVENARLTAKRRIFTGGANVRPDGTFDAGIDVYVVDTPDGELGASSAPPVQAVEYSFDAAPLLEWIGYLERTCLNRVGIVRGIVDGESSGGAAESGTAIRLRYMPTVQAAEEKAREWDYHVPRMIRLLAMVDALPVAAGGYGRTWADLVELPSVERGEPLPVDEVETIDSSAAAVAGRVMSRETAVRRMHPEWTDEAIAEELDRIAGDTSADRATMPTLNGLGAVIGDPSSRPPDPAAHDLQGDATPVDPPPQG